MLQAVILALLINACNVMLIIIGNFKMESVSVKNLISKINSNVKNVWLAVWIVVVLNFAIIVIVQTTLKVNLEFVYAN